MNKLSDREVVLLAMQGKDSALGELFTRYQKMVYFIALKVCNNEADAQDVVQETFIKVDKYICNLKEVDAFKSWLYQIVIGSCKHLFRKNHQVNHYLENIIGEDYIIENRKEYVPESSMRFNTDKEVLEKCLNELSAQQRLVVVLFYFEQMTIKEIEEVTRIPEGTIKSRLSYARKALYETLTIYEKQHGQKVSFHSLDKILIAFFAQTFQELKTPVVLTTLPTKLSMKNLTKHGIMQSFLYGILSICVVVGVSSIVFRNNIKNDQNYKVNEQLSDNTTFHSIQVGEETIVNARDAYFTLLMWAYDETELQNKKTWELTIYKSLYDEVKRCGGAYYNLLVDQGWGGAFENLL